MTDLTAQDAAWSTRDHLDDPVIGELRNRFGPDAFTVQATRTGVPVVWVKREQLLEVGDFLKKLPKPYVMLFDYTAWMNACVRTVTGYPPRIFPFSTT
ncbi:NADH dehydrogenase I chain C; chain D [Salmonella enterica subsp. diarizonae]|uniref:NADH dehydrogenase I chain C chain D n=1 Tax=Salmonella diarizonae TaxID=59204 RepID=A0A379TVX0_SALDZ|nr:NADH dehydrogenase I chain C; chain D [Salmonella enterica subsp. diarizonae]